MRRPFASPPRFARDALLSHATVAHERATVMTALSTSSWKVDSRSNSTPSSRGSRSTSGPVTLPASQEPPPAPDPSITDSVSHYAIYGGPSLVSRIWGKRSIQGSKPQNGGSLSSRPALSRVSFSPVRGQGAPPTVVAVTVSRALVDVDPFYRAGVRFRFLSRFRLRRAVASTNSGPCQVRTDRCRRRGAP